MTRLPRLLDRNAEFVRTIHPLQASVTLNITPLSTASLQLAEDDMIPERYFVEMFIPSGSAGIYRVCAPQNSYGDDVSETELEHAVVEVGDYLVRDKYNQMMPAGQAVQTIFSHYRGNFWRLGDTSILGTKSIAVVFDHDTVLQALITLMDQLPDYYMTFDFSSRPWTLGFARRGTEVMAEGRLSRNVQGAKITYDDSELCTRAYYEQESRDANGDPSSIWKSIDADTIGRYGVVEREVLTGSGYTQAECEYTVSEYLRKHKEPKISVEIDADDLSQITGEALDSFTIGKLFRLALPDYDLTVEHNITMLAYDDVYGEQTHVVVYLGQEEDSTVTYIHEISNGTATGASSSGGGGGSRKNVDDTFKKFRTIFQKQDDFIDLAAQELKDKDSILRQAGLYLDRNGALVYADENEYDEYGNKTNTIMGRVNVKAREVTTYVEDVKKQLRGEIKVQSDRVSIIVDDATGRIKAPSIIAAINDSDSSILLNADRIRLTGSTTMNDIFTVGGSFLHIKAGTYFDTGGALTIISGGSVQTSEYRINGNGLTLKVADITISGNLMTIKYTDGSTRTFNKAATLTGAWSSGTFTVTASTGATLTTSLAPATGAATKSGSTISIPIKATISGSGTVYDTGKSADVQLGNVCDSMSMTRVVAGVSSQGATTYNGKLYYYNNVTHSYVAASDSNHYWYYSNTNRSGTNTVYY